jgi:hypothetical protein
MVGPDFDFRRAAIQVVAGPVGSRTNRCGPPPTVTADWPGTCTEASTPGGKSISNQQRPSPPTPQADETLPRTVS